MFTFVLVAAIAAVGYLSWDRWLRYDDAKDMQGTWALADGSATIVIDNRYLILTPGVKYQYALNSMDKTISFNFDDLGGGGRYQFSKDRTMMAIVEGEASDLVGDVKRSLEFASFDEAEDAAKTTVFVKVSNSTDASKLPEGADAFATTEDTANASDLTEGSNGSSAE